MVFPEIAESYANDCDIICKFAYNFEIPITSSTSDRIGLYRVPYFQPHEYLAVRWVHEAKENCLVFNAAEIPKDEDFYQFQYLRTENGQEQAIGASIPFQIQIPKNDELCTVEDDEVCKRLNRVLVGFFNRTEVVYCILNICQSFNSCFSVPTVATAVN